MNRAAFPPTTSASGGFRRVNLAADLGIAGNVDDEIAALRGQQFAVAGGHGQAQFPGQHQARRAFILVGNAHDFDGRILVEQLHQSPARPYRRR